ncbi:hypothetical protein Aca07nite_31520 [Actinoplanes capillaceus]|uniref:Antitoxin FitA-like ribbon-helix-helix domain-containing protein n=1 Tax=Actinoplanes campanulatus TaxID=113559 RepID=A0ABQ3WHZ3_9ACTN|nr:plasmid stabilization protein [Actinoplanes capillaceus]GID45877.1 hypothetical protein Aca07nite_31520 [Actinoplanes capillaceus]
MATVDIGDLDEFVTDRLRRRAARNGRSVEAEARAILTAAVTDEEPAGGLFSALTDRFGALGGVDLDLPPRDNPARAAVLPE